MRTFSIDPDGVGAKAATGHLKSDLNLIYPMTQWGKKNGEEMSGAHFRLEMSWRGWNSDHEQEEVSALWLMPLGITLDTHLGHLCCPLQPS